MNIDEGLQPNEVVTCHYLDSEYGSMPSDATGPLWAHDGWLRVGDAFIRPDDVWTLHRGECDHPSDPRSDRARENFRRKYE